jgi:23S rRNA (pseudouridine1915-N3)-methyltransferase
MNITFITLGDLSESHWRLAAAEYVKRLGAFGAVREINLKEARLPKNPSEGEINAALEEEGERILKAIPSRSYVTALCIEGKMFSSVELSRRLSEASDSGAYSSLCFIVGSSHGLSPAVKASAHLRLSMSQLTFPHQLARVMLYECVYRCMDIARGGKYHK